LWRDRAADWTHGPDTERALRHEPSAHGPGQPRRVGRTDRGLVELPSSLAWSGRRRYDLDTATDRLWLYKRVLEGAQTADDLRRFVNPALLRGMWASLPLSRRVRAFWEDRFPELAIRRSA
jgi:hypothetical protein